MKRHTLWFFLCYAIALSLPFAVIKLWPDTRIILDSMSSRNQVEKLVRDLDPNSPSELPGKLCIAMKIDVQHFSPFSENIDELLEWLTTESVNVKPYGIVYPRKKWATDAVIAEVKHQYHLAGPWGSPYNYMTNTRMYDRDMMDAVGTWSFARHRFWLKVGAAIGTGIGTGLGLFWLGTLMIPLIIAFSLFAGILLGKANAPPVSYKQLAQFNQLFNPAGSNGSHGPPSDVNAEVEDQPRQWPLVVAIGVALVFLDRRRLIRTIGMMTSRAPPAQQEDAMIRTIVALIIAMCLPGTCLAETQKLYVNVGEWAFGRGTATTWIYESGRFTNYTAANLNGSALEEFATYKLIDRQLDFTAGSAAGSLSTPQGWKPYVGIYTGLSLDLKPWTIGGSFSSRHRRHSRLADNGSLDLVYDFGQTDLGMSYQPVRLHGPWTHRLAVHVAHEFRHFTLLFETRTTLESERRLSMNVDVSVPFGK